MTQAQYIDLIYNMLSPVDKTGRFHKAQIEAVCDVVYSTLLSRSNDDILGDLDLYSKEYTGQTATLDGTRGIYYVTLPVAIVPIPGITSGIREINTATGLDLDFIPTKELEMYYADGSAAHTADDTIGYWLQGNKIWFDESMTAAIAAAGVRIILLPRFSSYARTDNVNIPGATDVEFVQQVLQLISPTQAVDLKANNA